MRHNKKFNHLGRKTAHRSAMLSNMANSLIMHKRIFTTVPKAKALRGFVEPLITKSKEDTTNMRRAVFSHLQNKEAVTELFQNVSQKVGDRPGGYTRIIKTGFRLGDNAAMCFIELVDFNENMLSDSKTKKTRTRRSRRKASGTEATAAAPTAKESKKSEASAKATDKADDAAVNVAERAEESTAEGAAKVTDKPAEKKADKPEKAAEAKAAKPDVKKDQEDTAATETDAKA